MKTSLFYILFCLSILAPAHAESQSTPGKFNADELRRDLSEIRDKLVQNHPAPYLFTSKDSFDVIFTSLLKKIDHPMNAGEYFLMAASLVESIHCGHTWISLPETFWKPDTAIFLPISLMFIGDKVYASKSYEDIPAGAEVIGINDQPVKVIMTALEKYVNADGFTSTGKLAGFSYTFPDLFAIQYGSPAGYAVTFMSPGQEQEKKVFLKPVTRLRAWENPSGIYSAFSDNKPSLLLEIMPEKKLAIISIRTFGFYNEPEKFRNFIDSAFNELKILHVNHMILDLRGNRGGDPFCSSYLFSYLEKSPVPYFLHTASPDYTPLEKPVPMPIQNAYEGSLFVLTDGASFSSTGHLCALLKYHKRATFVGEETGGTYACNDDHMGYTTTITGIMLHMARTTFTAAVQGMDRSRGIQPDVKVLPSVSSILAGKDNVMESAIAEILKTH